MMFPTGVPVALPRKHVDYHFLLAHLCPTNNFDFCFLVAPSSALICDLLLSEHAIMILSNMVACHASDYFVQSASSLGSTKSCCTTMHCNSVKLRQICIRPA